MPKIGLRTLKTSLSVFFTMFVYLFLYLISPSFAQTWYSPFFAGIAAVYSMQKDQGKSFALARIRSFGSIFGGFFGMFLIIIYEHTLMDTLVSNFGYATHLFVLYIITSIFMVLLIYLMVYFKQHDLVFVAALTYLSVTISLRNNLPVVPFAINRISSTIIGVLITLGVNQFHWHRYRNNDVLFVSALDQCLLTKDKKFSSYTSYTLRELISEGMQFTVSTTRTPASLKPIFNDFTLPLSLMIMNGSCVYEMDKEKYTEIKMIDPHAILGLNQFFESKNRIPFVTTIVDQALSIYHHGFANAAEEKFYHDRKNDYFRNYIKGKFDETHGAVFYMMIDHKDMIDQYVEDLKLSSFYSEITVQVYPYDPMDDYYFLKIYASEASKKHAMISFIEKHQKRKVIVFGFHVFDVELMQLADFSITLSHADEHVKKHADYVIPSNQPDELVKLMKKMYHQKDIDRFINLLQNK